MQAIEIEAEVGDDHAIHVQIPDDWATAKGKSHHSTTTRRVELYLEEISQIRIV